MNKTETSRGLKRKRNEPENTDDFSRITGKLHHGLKDVRRAAKKAKIFETQKLVKRLKDLRGNAGNDSDIAQNNEQLMILKAIDHEAVANTAIKTKITKDRVLSQHERIQEALAREISHKALSSISQNTLAAKVQSRLLSSKILATEISSLCDDLRTSLGHESKKTRVRIVKDDDQKIHGAPKDSLSKDTMSSSSGEEGTDKGADGIIHALDFTEDGELSDNDSWESGSISINEKIGEDEAGASATAPLRHTPKRSSATSTFLPSLSVGFVRGSDVSDWSDTEAKLADSQKKKNRRGQRARQAIWEKKYGKNANHKKREFKHSNKVSSKGDSKGINGGSQRDPPRSKWDKTPDSRLEQPDHHLLRLGGNHGSYGPKVTKKDDRPLHPSWEAKRKLKEKQNAGIIPTQGTKIKFTD